MTAEPIAHLTTQPADLLKALADMLGDLAAEGLTIAFSGGVDSALLLAVACRSRRQTDPPVRAVFFQSFLYPDRECSEARQLAEAEGAVFSTLSFTPEHLAEIKDNPPDRCYRCKSMLFKALLADSQGRDYAHVIDGTNLDDDPKTRPGMQALAELKVRSPLRELGINKSMVRSLAGALGLPVSQKPSAPCLATRLPFGCPLEPAVLAQIAAGEDLLRQIGLQQVRLRLHGQVARLELKTDDFPLLLERRNEIVAGLKSLGFVFISLDLEGFRSGAMDLTK